jgi:AraC-like DNA-binding protein
MVNYYEKVKATPEIFQQLSYKELLFAKYNCPVEKKIIGKWWQHNYFMYMVTGKQTIHTPNHSWMLTPGKAVFMKKGACIQEKFFDEILCIMSFFVPDSYLQPFLRENISILKKDDLPPATDDLLIPIELNDAMTTFYESMFPYFNSNRPVPEQLLELKFRELLYIIISNPVNVALTSYLHTLLPMHGDGLQKIMEANCLFNLQLEDYAKLCNRSLSSFKRDFQLVYKAPPGQWIVEQKVNYAKQLLITSDKPIADVCFESGFESSTHFSRVFKNHFDISPLQFRKQSMSTH